MNRNAAGTRVVTRRWRISPSKPRALTVVIVTVSVVLLAAGCSSGSRSSAPPGASSTAAGQTGSTDAVAYSSCMRSHGVPSFPDPTGSGQVPKADPQQLRVSTSQLQAAQQACRPLFPNTGSTDEQRQETQCAMAGECSQAVAQPWMSGLRKLAHCLRTHGEPNWPDPILTSQGIPHFDYGRAGIDHHAPPVLAHVDACNRLTGFEGLPLP